MIMKYFDRIWVRVRYLCRIPMKWYMYKQSHVTGQMSISLRAGCLSRFTNEWKTSKYKYEHPFEYECKADSRPVPSQWETSLQSNAVSHLLDANLESAQEWNIMAYL